jgi:hypothetical protein
VLADATWGEGYMKSRRRKREKIFQESERRRRMKEVWKVKD